MLDCTVLNFPIRSGPVRSIPVQDMPVYVVTDCLALWCIAMDSSAKFTNNAWPPTRMRIRSYAPPRACATVLYCASLLMHGNVLCQCMLARHCILKNTQWQYTSNVWIAPYIDNISTSYMYNMLGVLQPSAVQRTLVQCGV